MSVTARRTETSTCATEANTRKQSKKLRMFRCLIAALQNWSAVAERVQ